MLRVCIAIIIFFISAFPTILCQENEVFETANKLARKQAITTLAKQIELLPMDSSTTIGQFFSSYEKAYKNFVLVYSQRIEEIGIDINIEKSMYKITIAIPQKQIIDSLIATSLEYRLSFTESNITYFRENTQPILYATGSFYFGHFIDDAWSKASAKDKWLAVHFAQMDALQKINEIIDNLHMSQDLKVNDFLAESDEIRNDFNRFIRNFIVNTEPHYDNNGVVEVIIEIRVRDIVAQLESICKKKYNGSKWNTKNFGDIYTMVKSHSFIAKGKSTISHKSNKEIPKIIYIPQWANKTLLIVGEGVIPQNENKAKARKIALERAKADSYHKLTTYVMELPLQEDILLKNFIAQNETVRNNINITIKKTKIIKIYTKNNFVKVELELYLAKIWKIIAHVYRER